MRQSQLPCGLASPAPARTSVRYRSKPPPHIPQASGIVFRASSPCLRPPGSIPSQRAKGRASGASFVSSTSEDCAATCPGSRPRRRKSGLLLDRPPEARQCAAPPFAPMAAACPNRTNQPSSHGREDLYHQGRINRPPEEKNPRRDRLWLTRPCPCT